MWHKFSSCTPWLECWSVKPNSVITQEWSCFQKVVLPRSIFLVLWQFYAWTIKPAKPATLTSKSQAHGLGLKQEHVFIVPRFPALLQQQTGHICPWQVKTVLYKDVSLCCLQCESCDTRSNVHQSLSPILYQQVKPVLPWLVKSTIVLWIPSIRLPGDGTIVGVCQRVKMSKLWTIRTLPL